MIFKRGHCPSLGIQNCYSVGCNHFVTNVEFLPTFEHERQIIKSHLNHCETHNNLIEVKKANFELSKIDNIIWEINKKDAIDVTEFPSGENK